MSNLAVIIVTLLASFPMVLLQMIDGKYYVSKERFYENMRMISDVQGYHQASSVFLVYPKDDEILGLDRSTLMLMITREFSNKLVFSLTLNYTEVIKHRKFYQTKMVKPLFVTFLHDHEELQMFEHMAHNYEMSYSIWFVIFAHKDIMDACKYPKGNSLGLGFDTEMTVKCNDEPRIKEWYALDKADDELIEATIATWDPKNKLRAKAPKELYERRNNLAGKILRVATVKESPFIREREGQMSGFFAKILEELSKTLNFSATTIYKDDIYGSLDNGSREWTGVIGRLTRNEADLGVAEFSMTGSRLDAVDFTYPVMLSQNNFYVRQPDGSALPWSGYFRVFNPDVWIAIEVVYLVSVTLITFIKVKTSKKSCNSTYNILENYLSIWGLFSFQSLPASALRIAYFSLVMNAFVIVSVYSACLISYLTVTTPGLPYRSVVEFAEDNTYRMIVLEESSDYDLFSRSRDPVMKALMKRMIDKELLPKTMVDGFTQVCEHKCAFYTSEAVKLQISTSLPCNVAFLKSGRIDSLAITLMKKSQYTGIINYQLQKFKNVGIMQRLKSIAYTKISPSGDKFNPMNVRGTVTILAILGIGMVLSLVVLVIEIAMSHRSRHRGTA